MRDDRSLTHPGRDQYAVLVRVMTRWSDYDMLGHVNNVEYYRFYETAILSFLREAGLDWHQDPVIPLAAENGCRFLRPVDICGYVEVGVRVAHLGNSSVRYEVAVYMPEDHEPYATGFFIHVFTDRASGRPIAIPQPIRAHFMNAQTPVAAGTPRLLKEAQLLPTQGEKND